MVRDLLKESDLSADGDEIKLSSSCKDFKFLIPSSPTIILIRLLDKSRYCKDTALASPAVLRDIDIVESFQSL